VSEEPPELRGEQSRSAARSRTRCRAFDAERAAEGRHLQRDMQRRTAAIQHATASIRRRLPAALAALRRQVEERLVRLVGGAELDRSRVARRSPCSPTGATSPRSSCGSRATSPRSPPPCAPRAGREADRVPPAEVHRELNTTGAKAGDPGITDLVLAAKGEVEKLREQVQNVE
jgi:uncharacterized protein YicC (UPF0701 family)